MSKPTPAQMLRYLKDHRRLLLAKVDGRLWWTNGYLAVQCKEKADKDAVLSLLPDYNLKPEPMCCEVQRTIVRTQADPPNVAGLVKTAVKGASGSAEAVTLGGNPITVGMASWGKETSTEVWRIGAAGLAGFNARHRHLIEMLTGWGEWLAPPSESKPFVRMAGGTAVAIAMPVRLNLGVDSKAVDEVLGLAS